MAIQNRRGVYSDFTPSKMVPGELAVVQSGDPNNTSGKAVYAAFGTSGDVKRLATEDDLSKKVNTETGKGLSTNDYTTEEKNKLSGIASGAEVNVQSNWNQNDTSADDFIKNKPTKTSDFTNDGDGTSNFATQQYVQQNGGKIDTISVNGTQQTITNKNVDIPVPVIDSTLTQTGKAADAKVTGDELASVKSDIDNITSVKDYVDLNDVTITTGNYIKSDGTIGTNGAYSYTEDYIELPDGVESVTVNRNVYTSSGNLYRQTIMVWWYDSEKTLLGTGTNTTSDNLLTSKRSLNWANVKYIRVNFSTYRVHPFVKLNYYSELRYIRTKTADDTADDFTETGIYWIGSSMTGLPTGNIGVLTVKKITSGIIAQTFITVYNAFTRLKTNNTWKEWVQLKNPLITETYSVTYTTTKVQQNTGIILKANKTYRIMFVSNREGRINVYGYGNSNNVKRVYPWMNETYFTNDDTDRVLYLYNYDGIADTVSIIVYETDNTEEKALNIPKVYTVGKSPVNTYDFSSVTECFLALKDDNSPKIVEIWEGDYDIYQEYVDANVPVYTGDNPSIEYFDYCVWVPQNTHVIGKGIVRLKWMPDPAEDSITPNQCKCVSPLNVAGSCTIENIEVYCKNGRYALHNDALGKERYYGAIQRYINCSFYKYTNDVDSVSGNEYGFTPTTGFGIDKAMHHVYENCTFVNYAEDRAFYGHSRKGDITSEAESPNITLLNCVIDTEGTKAVKFGTGTAYGGNQILHIRVMFNSCYISGQVWCQLENSNSSNCENCFDVQYLNCGNVSMRINDPDNEYPPKAYNTTLTMVN